MLNIMKGDRLVIDRLNSGDKQVKKTVKTGVKVNKHTKNMANKNA